MRYLSSPAIKLTLQGCVAPCPSHTAFRPMLVTGLDRYICHPGDHSSTSLEVIQCHCTVLLPEDAVCLAAHSLCRVLRPQCWQGARAPCPCTPCHPDVWGALSRGCSYRCSGLATRCDLRKAGWHSQLDLSCSRETRLSMLLVRVAGVQPHVVREPSSHRSLFHVIKAMGPGHSPLLVCLGSSTLMLCQPYLEHIHLYQPLALRLSHVTPHTRSKEGLSPWCVSLVHQM